MRKLVVFPLVVTFLIAAVFGSAAAAAPQAQATLEGTVTVNGDPAPANVGVVALLADGTECGRGLTGLGATLTISLAEECPVGKTVLFALAATEDRAATEAIVRAGRQTITVAFEGLSTESLQAIGAAPPAADEEAQAAVEKALKEAGAPVALITGTSLFWLVLAVSVGGLLLLGCMVAATMCHLLWARGRTAHAGEGLTTADQEPSYTRQIEGMVLIMVIVAIILLGISQKIGDQGLVSVLAAIVGYAVGRATGERG